MKRRDFLKAAPAAVASVAALPSAALAGLMPADELAPLRVIHRLRNGAWERVRMAALRVGDVFRVGSIGDDDMRAGVYRATGNPQPVDGPGTCEIMGQLIED